VLKIKDPSNEFIHHAHFEYALYIADFYSASRVFVLEQLHRMQRKGPGAPIAALTQRGTVDPATACYFLWKTIALVRF
jgi:hypothetical protein